MANHLKRERQFDVLRLLVRFGDSCQDLMKERFQDLTLRHVQVDEMHSFVHTRQVNLKVDQKDNPNIGEQYLWYGIDQDTKLVPTFLVGKRSADNARRLMVDLRSRLAIPTPGEADRRGGYKPIIKISTDGLAAYPEAVDLAFGPYAEYGQLIKNYGNANMPGKYSPGELTGADRRPVFGNMNPWTICTSHIERANLTVRTFVRRFTRLSLGFSKKLENLKAACAVNFAFYNFCWRPRTTRITPAMAAGVVNTLWNMDNLYDAAMGA